MTTAEQERERNLRRAVASLNSRIAAEVQSPKADQQQLVQLKGELTERALSRRIFKPDFMRRTLSYKRSVAMFSVQRGRCRTGRRLKHCFA